MGTLSVHHVNKILCSYNPEMHRCLLLVLLIFGCGSSMMKVVHPTVTGHLEVAGKAIAPTRCISGERFSFYGADLIDDSSGTTVRVVIDPLDGPRVRLMMRGRDVVYDRKSCSTLAANLQPTGWRVNEYRDFAGDVNLECGDVRGRVEFDHCH